MFALRRDFVQPSTWRRLRSGFPRALGKAGAQGGTNRLALLRIDKQGVLPKMTGCGRNRAGTAKS